MVHLPYLQDNTLNGKAAVAAGYYQTSIRIPIVKLTPQILVKATGQD